MISMSDELKERNILKLILIVRFACATLDLGYPMELQVYFIPNSQKETIVIGRQISRKLRVTVRVFMSCRSGFRYVPLFLSASIKWTAGRWRTPECYWTLAWSKRRMRCEIAIAQSKRTLNWACRFPGNEKNIQTIGPSNHDSDYLFTSDWHTLKGPNNLCIASSEVMYWEPLSVLLAYGWKPCGKPIYTTKSTMPPFHALATVAIVKYLHNCRHDLYPR
jgi:hypothetical protein